MRNLALAAISALAILVLAVTACDGDSEDVADNATAEPTQTATIQPTVAPTAERTEAPSPTPAPTPVGHQVSFDISLNDNFFEPSAFTAQAGDVITFNITNHSIQRVLHGMHIAGADNVFDQDYGGDDAGVLIVSPDEKTSVNWTAPAEPGTYNFYCSFHVFEMLGTITVK